MSGIVWHQHHTLIDALSLNTIKSDNRILSCIPITCAPLLTNLSVFMLAMDVMGNGNAKFIYITVCKMDYIGHTLFNPQDNVPTLN